MKPVTSIIMHDATVDHVRLNTLYVRKNNDQWSLLLMRNSPGPHKIVKTYTNLLPAIYEFWWRPRDATRPAGGIDWTLLGWPPSISGEFFRFGTSLALGVWATTFIKSWLDNPEKPLRRSADKTSPRTQEDDIDPKDWVLDVIYELDKKWFRRFDFISQATELTKWMYGDSLTDCITTPSCSQASPSLSGNLDPETEQS